MMLPQAASLSSIADRARIGTCVAADGFAASQFFGYAVIQVLQCRPLTPCVIPKVKKTMFFKQSPQRKVSGSTKRPPPPTSLLSVPFPRDDDEELEARPQPPVEEDEVDPPGPERSLADCNRAATGTSSSSTI